jgi:hypothetical protein
MPVESRPCKICLVQHDDEIHAATLNVHSWFHEQVTQGFYEELEEQGMPPAPALEEFQVA